MPDEFEQIRSAMIRAQNGGHPSDAAIQLMLDNQREIMACLAMIARGGTLPACLAKDLQERAKKITKILEG